MKSHTYERMRKFRILNHAVRLWIEDTGLNEEYFGYVVRDAMKVFGEYHPERHIRVVATKIVDIPGINAVEIIDGEGSGVVVYKDWP